MLFNEQGILNLDEVVMNHPSWQKIMADGIVTAEELTMQADTVTALLHRVDETLNDEQKQLRFLQPVVFQFVVLKTVEKWLCRFC